MPHDVFISHSSKDKTVSDAVCHALERAGIRCWIAPRDVTPGLPWPKEIIKGINGSRVMVLVFSSHANASQQVELEVAHAISRRIIVIPFRVEEVPPTGTLEYYLVTPHWLDALSPPMEKHLDHLTQTVKLLVERLQHETSEDEDPRPPTPPSPQPKPSQPVRGKDIRVVVSLSDHEALHGCKKTIEAAGQKTSVQIPAFVKNGQELRFQHQGRPGSFGGEKGDLVVRVEVKVAPTPAKKDSAPTRHTGRRTITSTSSFLVPFDKKAALVSWLSTVCGLAVVTQIREFTLIGTNLAYISIMVMLSALPSLIAGRLRGQEKWMLPLFAVIFSAAYGRAYINAGLYYESTSPVNPSHFREPGQNGALMWFASWTGMLVALILAICLHGWPFSKSVQSKRPFDWTMYPLLLVLLPLSCRSPLAWPVLGTHGDFYVGMFQFSVLPTVAILGTVMALNRVGARLGAMWSMIMCVIWIDSNEFANVGGPFFLVVIGLAGLGLGAMYDAYLEYGK